MKSVSTSHKTRDPPSPYKKVTSQKPKDIPLTWSAAVQDAIQTILSG